jgi:Zn-dependent protease with chaperone function
MDTHLDSASADREREHPPMIVEPALAAAHVVLKIPGIPSSWNFYLISLGAMLALAGLVFVGSVFAKEWTERQHFGLFLAGLASFVVLFTVYAFSLKVAELSVVTFGWIVFLQVGLVLLDTIHYGLRLPTGKWVAIVALIVLQAYLILAPNLPNASASGGTA